MSVCQEATQELVARIEGLDDNLAVVETQNRLLKQEFPNAAIDIWRERLLTSILKEDWEAAQKIVRDRIDHHDLGEFQVTGQSFYRLADEYIGRRAR